MAADLGAPVYRRPVAVPVPVAIWTGFYGGFNGGYGWSDTSITSAPFQSSLGPLVVPGAALSERNRGPVFGGQLGYNYQIGAVVIGIEGDFDWAGLNNSAAAVLLDPTGGTGADGLMVHRDTEWLASIRGRLGYSWGTSLLYVTGGGAWEKLNTNVLLSTDTSTNQFSTSFAGSFSTTKSGWVLGVGYEWMIAPAWIVRAEYLHYDFRNGDTIPANVNCGFLGRGAVCGANINSDNDHVDVVRLGLSYKLGYAGFPGAYR